MRRANTADMRDDLQSFAQSMDGVRVETLGPGEHRVRWQAGDRAGSTQVAALRSGMSLMLARVSWDRPFSLAVHQAASPLKFMMLRGDGPRLTTGDGEVRQLEGASVHVGQITRSVDLRFDFGPGRTTSHHAELGLEIDAARLCELLGSAELPEAVQQLQRADGAYPTLELGMSAALSRLFDEVSHCDARGRSRPLYLEAKCMELLALLVDELEDDTRGRRPSRHDVERLEQARGRLVACLSDPPSLAVLARAAGMSETKLKAGFRALFGSPVYTYLRARRMEEAERLLRERRHSVSEVALRVGYGNPSKFAAAFRRHFGVPPARS